MRRLLLLLLVFTVVATSAIGVNASTDCERWIASYKQALDQQSSVKKLKAAKLRMRRYAQRKIAGYTLSKPSPGPHLVRASSVRPRLTPQQMLRRFSVLCGELPNDVAPGVLDARAVPDFKFETASFEPVPTADAVVPGFLAQNEAPVLAGSSVPEAPIGSQGAYPPSFAPIIGGGFPGSSAPAGGTSSSAAPGGGTAGSGTAPAGGTATGGTPGGGTPGTPIVGTTGGTTGTTGTTPSGGTTGTLPPPVSTLPSTPPEGSGLPPTLAPVPEPGSVFLLLTGMAGGLGVLRGKVRR